MNDFVVRILRSPAELPAIAPRFNALCERSATLPTSRAEHVSLWHRHFAADKPLAILAVEHEGRLVAILPIVGGRWLGMNVGTLPGNDWSPAGDLLLDTSCAVDETCDALVAALGRGNWSLLDFSAVIPKLAAWQAFLRALDRSPLAYARRQQCRVNVVRLDRDWESYFASRSHNHRRHIRRSLARARREGLIELVCHDQLRHDQVEPLLAACFELEAAGWKGRSRGAVLSVPRAWKFYVEQARLLAAAGQLCVVVLKLAGKPIAFEYGWLAGNVYYSPKVGYDEALGRLAPGQLLRALWIERLMREGRVGLVDFLGHASPATSAWATQDYGVDRLVVATAGPAARAIVELYRRAWPVADSLRSWRGAARGEQRHRKTIALEPGEHDVPQSVGAGRSQPVAFPGRDA